MTRDRLPALLVALAVIAWLALALRVAPYQVDDAWITYRYSARLAAGRGRRINGGTAGGKKSVVGLQRNAYNRPPDARRKCFSVATPYSENYAQM